MAINLMTVVTAAIMLVVLAFVLALGQTIVDTNTNSICTSAGGLYSYFENTTTGFRVEPITNSVFGCCSAYNYSTAGTAVNHTCRTWMTNNYAINSSLYGMQANNTLASWQTTIALVLAAAFVIGILVAYMLGSLGKRGGM